MIKTSPNYSEYTIGRLFGLLCGNVALAEDCKNKSYWIGALLAAKNNLEAAIKILYDFSEAGIVQGCQAIVDTLIEKIFAELEKPHL